MNRPIAANRLLHVAIYGALALAICALAAFGALSRADRQVQDLRFGLGDRLPSQDVVFVDIDAASLTALGVWPWPRRIHAELLDLLMAMGADEVAMDVDFSTASNPEDDATLETALTGAGGYAYLAAFQQRAADGSIVVNRPLPAFAAQADEVLVNVEGDDGGTVRSVPAALVDPAMPSLALALAPQAEPIGQITIDFGIDITAIDRIAAVDILRGTIAPERIAGRQVVIGASAIELRDIFRVPRFGNIPGPVVQIAASETLKAGRNLRPLGQLEQTAALLLLALLLGWMQIALPPLRLVAASLALAVGVEVAAASAYVWAGQLWPTTALHLALALAVCMRLAREYAERRRSVLAARARLAYLARHDSLTGALSPLAFTEYLDRQLVEGATPSLLLVKFTRLRSIGQALGQPLADAVVVAAAARLTKAHLPAIGRISGDVFALALSGTNALSDSAHDLARLLDAPYRIDEHDIFLQTSFGAYQSVQGGLETGARMLRRADIALEKAQSLRHPFAAFDIEDERLLTRRQALNSALHQAIEGRQFNLVFQPQIDLQNGRMVGVEALVRWVSPTLGPVGPADFVPVAEETGLIVRLGQWVMTEACHQAQQTGFDGRLAVNVSPVQFQLSDVPQMVHDILDSTGFPAGRLDIEVTESLLVEREGKVVADLERLRAMGVGIAIDDFGTGFSSLSYLAHLPFDKLKIDQSFVRNMDRPGNRAIIDSVVALAARLGKTLVAEGVETAEQADYLRAIGCDIAQGYHFGRPASAEAAGMTRPSRRVA